MILTAGYGRWNKKYGLTLLELVVSLIIIGIFAGTLVLFIQKASVNAKEVSLIMELKNIRLSLVLYRALNEKYPQALKDLVEAKTGFGLSDTLTFQEKFLESLKIDKEGNPKDPFGNIYYYDQGRGVVSSVTKGYEGW